MTIKNSQGLLVIHRMNFKDRIFQNETPNVKGLRKHKFRQFKEKIPKKKSATDFSLKAASEENPRFYSSLDQKRKQYFSLTVGITFSLS